MLPHLGAGAGQGLEDAYLISKLLTHPQTTLENLEVIVIDLVGSPRYLTHIFGFNVDRSTGL